MLDKPRAVSRRRKAARPRELLDAALAVFVEKGFAAARPEEIALRAGVSKGTLYLYFHSKEELLSALINDGFLSHIALQTHGVADNARTSQDLLRDVLTTWRSTLIQSHAGGIFKLIFTEARAFPELAQFWLHEVMGPLRRAISSIVARGVGRGEFRAVDPDLVAHSVFLPIVMVCLHRHAIGPFMRDEDLITQPDLFSRHLEFVLEGLIPPSPSKEKNRVRIHR